MLAGLGFFPLRSMSVDITGGRPPSCSYMPGSSPESIFRAMPCAVIGRPGVVELRPDPYAGRDFLGELPTRASSTNSGIAVPGEQHAALKCMARFEGPSRRIGRMKVGKVHRRSEQKLQ